MCDIWPLWRNAFTKNAFCLYILYEIGLVLLVQSEINLIKLPLKNLARCFEKVKDLVEDELAMLLVLMNLSVWYSSAA